MSKNHHKINKGEFNVIESNVGVKNGQNPHILVPSQRVDGGWSTFKVIPAKIFV